ncbi:hypothetical protein C8R46DRAFT_1194162 [Mycena filopes]|nr:hypothetical protein C8R46DRAFT_1194162 [Mycena filopes]
MSWYLTIPKPLEGQESQERDESRRSETPQDTAGNWGGLARVVPADSDAHGPSGRLGWLPGVTRGPDAVQTLSSSLLLLCAALLLLVLWIRPSGNNYSVSWTNRTLGGASHWAERFGSPGSSASLAASGGVHLNSGTGVHGDSNANGTGQGPRRNPRRAARVGTGSGIMPTPVVNTPDPLECKIMYWNIHHEFTLKLTDSGFQQILSAYDIGMATVPVFTGVTGAVSGMPSRAVKASLDPMRVTGTGSRLRP